MYLPVLESNYKLYLFCSIFYIPVVFPTVQDGQKNKGPDK
jgi:hypothetical protein